MIFMVKRARLSRSGGKPRSGRLVKPFEYSIDVRGDTALFIPVGTKMSDPSLIAMLHSITPSGDIYELVGDKFVSRHASTSDPVFFRLVDSKGVQQHTHGWIRYNPKTKLAEVTQYG
jgi:hypothetical protein